MHFYVLERCAPSSEMHICAGRGCYIALWVSVMWKVALCWLALSVELYISWGLMQFLPINQHNLEAVCAMHHDFNVSFVCSAHTSRSLRWSRLMPSFSASLPGCGALKWGPMTRGSVLGMRLSGPESLSLQERLCWAWTSSGEPFVTKPIHLDNKQLSKF